MMRRKTLAAASAIAGARSEFASRSVKSTRWHSKHIFRYRFWYHTGNTYA